MYMYMYGLGVRSRVSVELNLCFVPIQYGYIDTGIEQLLKTIESRLSHYFQWY